MFRCLGLHPGTDFDAWAAAALAGGSPSARRRRELEGLYDHYLLAETARGRYRFHDLIREHAGALAVAAPPAERTPPPPAAGLLPARRPRRQPAPGSGTAPGGSPARRRAARTPSGRFHRPARTPCPS